jgi:hypothetical protein
MTQILALTEWPPIRRDERRRLFHADIIIARLITRINILASMFIPIDHIEQIDKEDVAAIGNSSRRWPSYQDMAFQRCQSDAVVAIRS